MYVLRGFVFSHMEGPRAFQVVLATVNLRSFTQSNMIARLFPRLYFVITIFPW